MGQNAKMNQFVAEARLKISSTTDGNKPQTI